MKRLLLLSALLIFACSTDSEGNPCIYEPTLTTQAATDITETSATLNGVISIVSENCEVPNNTEQGFVYSTEIQPTLEDTQVNVNGTNISTTIEGLTPNTTYYVRAFLTNNFGDFYGDEIDFTTEESSGCNETGTVTDQDGNSYDYLCYGDQAWTIENAEMVTYRDGTPIPEVTDNTEWASITTGAWSYFNNDPTKPRLYNWFAVMGIHDTDPNTPNKEFAPEGWHVPSIDLPGWGTLITHLAQNGYNYDGFTPGNGYDEGTSQGNGVAKAMASITGWYASTNEGAPGNDLSLNNSSGFNAFPVGYRLYEGGFSNEGATTYFWSSSEYFSGQAYHIPVDFRESFVYSNTSFLVSGYSVRFVRD
tara:strand:+ start:49 stop:1137 length:1089 start_codon:yes stop_codon:yes gene_type:complete